MDRLISMTDFVLNEFENSLEHPQTHIEDSILNLRVLNYARFLKQSLELWMFIPSKIVDGVWVVLEEPNINDFKSKPFCETGECEAYYDDLKEYQEAKDRRIFIGFKVKSDFVISNSFLDIKFYFFKNRNATIYLTDNTMEYTSVHEIFTTEDLVKHDLEITQTAKKQIGL